MAKIYGLDSVVRLKVRKICKALINRHKKKYVEIDGREEEITSQLERVLAEDLVTEIQKVFNEKDKRIVFDTYTYKKVNEAVNGADFMGIVDIELNNTRVRKAFLAQCKIAKGVSFNPYRGYSFQGASSKNILEQAEKMLKLTSDSFFFFYTSQGIFVVPAFQIRSINEKYKIDSSNYYYHTIEHFYSEFFKCFIGDEKIVSLGNSKSFPKESEPLEELLSSLNVNFVSYLKVSDKETSKINGK